MPSEWPIILTYHHLSDTDRSRYVLPSETFEAQLAAMLEDGFEPLPLDEAVATGPNGSRIAREKTFHLTFDDGLSSFASRAMAVLERLGLLGAATVFVPTAYVGGTNEWVANPTPLQRVVPWRDVTERLMGWDDLSHVRESGVGVESHGHAHLPMPDLTYEAALDDVSTAKRILGEHGFATRFIALPFGWRSEPAKRAMRDAGYEAGFAVKRGGRDELEIRRVPIYGTDSAWMHRLKLSGGYFRWLDAFGLSGGGRP
jgi:peptidoglycan/xylan/chitin deacetylase (PgdA/CDA1 family)